MKYPISETFTSLQGEGTYTGAAMHFVRLAGCNVGQFWKPVQLEAMDLRPLAERRQQYDKHSVCRTIDGHCFMCDTDYLKYKVMDEEEIINEVVASCTGRICITGGEPFLHDIFPLVSSCLKAGIAVHIETSGTRPISEYFMQDFDPYVWITCCPKFGFLDENDPYIDEWKLLVSRDTAESELTMFCDPETETRPVFIQPINSIHTVDDLNMRKAVEIVKLYPSYRLSAQLHKYLGVR